MCIHLQGLKFEMTWWSSWIIFLVRLMLILQLMALSPFLWLKSKTIVLNLCMSSFDGRSSPDLNHLFFFQGSFKVCLFVLINWKPKVKNKLRSKQKQNSWRCEALKLNFVSLFNSFFFKWVLIWFANRLHYRKFMLWKYQISIYSRSES